MTNRLNRWIDWVLATPSGTHENPSNIDLTRTKQEPSMPSTTSVRNTDQRITQLRAALVEIDDEATADPISAALILEEWRGREEQRNSRRLQLVAELRRREELGELADNPDVLAAIASYTSRTAEDRSKLAPIGRDRAWPAGKSDGRAVQRLEKWWSALIDLTLQLPDGDPDALRYIETQMTEWFRCQQGVLVAKASAAGSDVPQPELRDMPCGFSYGLRKP